jgi:hexosaminidase
MDCWQADPSIIADLDRGGTVRQLLERYVRAVHPQVVSRNRTAVYWEDMVLDAAVNVSVSAVPRETTVVQTWNDGPNNTKRIVQAGVPHHRLLRSYYLDCGHGDFLGNNSIYDDPNSDFETQGRSWCGPYKAWQRVYDYDIVRTGSPPTRPSWSSAARGGAVDGAGGHHGPGRPRLAAGVGDG